MNVKEFLKPIEGTLYYEAARLHLTDNYTMKELGQELRVSYVAATRRINKAAELLEYEVVNPYQFKQEYIWFLEQHIKDIKK